MSKVILQHPLTVEQIDLLLREFPQYTFFSISYEERHTLPAQDWGQTEVFFGNHLSAQMLQQASQLRWIHLPTDDTNHLCMPEIYRKGNVLVSETVPPHSNEVARFVIAAVMAFGKQLFKWKEVSNHPGLLWESKWRETMWDFSDTVLLQIGLNHVGMAITQQAQQLGLRTWGVQERRSFQPHCSKTIALKDLHSVLPNADVVVLSLPKDKKYYRWLGWREIELLKDDALLIVVGSNRVVDEQALAATGSRLRGIVIDAYAETPIPVSSSLWQLPNIIVTPQAATLPHRSQDVGFQTFCYNFRQYLHGNFSDMRNILNSKTRLPPLPSA